METLIEIVSENYIYFIVGGGILLLAIIGLISEKFKKNKEPKEEKIEEVKENISMPVVEDDFISEEKKADTENLFGSEKNETSTMDFYNNEPKPLEEENVQSAADFVNQDGGYEPQSLEQNTVKENVSEDLFAPFGETPVVEEKPVIEETTAVEEMPVVEETPVVEEMPVVEETPTVEETENRF